MKIYNLSNQLLKSDNISIIDDLKNSFNSEMLEKIYLIPKNITKEVIDKKINNPEYINRVRNTINYFKNKDIEKLILNKLKFFESNTNSKIKDSKIFTIIGLNTTTIYSTNVDGEDVTVLLLEATNGNEDILDMLLAHEFTHFIRKQKLNKDIFEESIGERFVTEGIASNYSREIVSNKKDSEYCIVNDETVEWVKNNINIIEEYVKNKMETTELMKDFFYMYIDKTVGIPPRTGYVYGYLKVKGYLENNNLMVKDILGIDWRKILIS